MFEKSDWNEVHYWSIKFGLSKLGYKGCSFGLKLVDNINANTSTA